jgi:Flp pilus assembly protein TadG
MRNTLQRFFRNQDGVTAIEFALLSPPILFIMLAIIEYAIIFHLQSLTTHAANEAARMVKTGADYCAGGVDKQTCVRTTVEKIMAAWIKPGVRTVTAIPENHGKIGAPIAGIPGSFGNSGELVSYTVGTTWNVITPFLFNGMAEGSVIKITAVTLVKNEDY